MPEIWNHKHEIEEKSSKSSRPSSKVVGLGLADLWEFPTISTDTAELTGQQTVADKTNLTPVDPLCIIMFIICPARPCFLLRKLIWKCYLQKVSILFPINVFNLGNFLDILSSWGKIWLDF